MLSSLRVHMWLFTFLLSLMLGGAAGHDNNEESSQDGELSRVESSQSELIVNKRYLLKAYFKSLIHTTPS